MFLPPDERKPWYPSQPDDGLSKRAEAVLLGPIGGSTLGQALVALLGR